MIDLFCGMIPTCKKNREQVKNTSQYTDFQQYKVNQN